VLRVGGLLLLLLALAGAREPAGHAVVLYGAADQHRIAILVAEGQVHVDRDGNGSIDGSAERLEPGVSGYYWTEVTGCDEKGNPGPYRLCLDVAADASGRPGLKLISTNPVGEIQEFHASAGFIPLGETPARAPRIRIHGPLRFALMDHWTGSTACRRLPREGGEQMFSVLVATPVLGTDDEAYVYPHLFRLQGEAVPEVSLRFEPDGGAPPPRIRVLLCDCGRRYRALADLPPTPAGTKATLHASFPGWKHGPLAEASFELEYAPPAARD